MPTHRILILNWRDPEHPQAGGAETYLFELARRWVRAGHRVAWLTAGFPGCAPTGTLDGVSVYRVGNRFTVYALVPMYYLLHLRGKFDVILDSENGIPFFSPLFSRLPRVCLIYHVHKRVFEQHLPPIAAQVFVWLELHAMPFFYRRSTFVSISETTRDEMLHYRMTRRPVPVVYPGVDARLRPGPKAHVPSIIYLGRLKEYKRIDVLVRAMVPIRARLPQAKLIIAGDGDRRASLEQLARELGVSQHVEFAGFVDDARKARLLSEAWVFASASSMEGWGISVIEANGCGTPAVVADSPGLRQAVEGGVSGTVTAPERIADELIAVLTDDALRARLSIGAQHRARQFSWDHAAEQMLAILEREAPMHGKR